MARFVPLMMVTVNASVKENATCPGVGAECKTLGADGLACCGAEHGAGFAFCQTDPDYLCCSGDSFAITCPSASGCSKSEYGIPMCQKEASVLEEVKDNSTCPGFGAECKTLGADGLACCGAEHGAGLAFCQTSPDYLCCSGDSYAITCPAAQGCSISEYGIPLCQKNQTVFDGVEDNATCPGVGQECTTVGADGLACCGAEHGVGLAFCQTTPDMLCCSGDSYAISCPASLGCSMNEYGMPLCQKNETVSDVTDNATCPGVGLECKIVGADGLACCGAEHGAGLAFCQATADMLCCSGDSLAISCPASMGCSITEYGMPLCQKNETVLIEVKDNSTCPGVGQECKTLGADGLACCGSEHGAGFAFCQTDPDYLCCSGDSFAISCPSSLGCSKNEYGIPLCQKEAVVV